MSESTQGRLPGNIRLREADGAIRMLKDDRVKEEKQQTIFDLKGAEGRVG